MLINVLMPTYNDEKTIEEALNSLKCQTYDNWHLTIINDGSKDNTEKVIKKYIKGNKLKEKITYLYQDNSDQLNALKNALNSIKNKDGLVFVLHSDDIINDNKVFQRAVEYFKKNNNVDAIIADYTIINKDSKIVGYQKVNNYINKISDIPLMGLWLGRNLYVDVAFFKYKVYETQVYYNYLTWNTPFWFCHKDKLDILNVKKVDFPFFKYRVFDENYINNEIGMLNVLNGELRTILLVLKNFDIPFYKIQYLIFRIFNKLKIKYKVLYKKAKSKNIYNIIKFVINKRISDEELVKYPYYTAILNFFKNYSDREIEIKDVQEEDVFLGSDVRFFNKKMLNNELPKIYNKIFENMNKGFNSIITNKKNYSNLINILKFLDIYEYINIKIK